MRPTLAALALCALTALAGAAGARAQGTAEASATAVTTGVAAGRLLTPEEYAAELAGVEQGLRSGETQAARDAAQALLAARVSHGDADVASDASLLGPVARGEASDPAEAARAAERLLALREALTEAAAGPAPAPDPAQLERLRRSQQRAALARGGEVGELPLEPLSVPERVRAALEAFWDWLGDLLHRFWKWLLKLWPEPRRRGVEDGAFELNLAVVGLVGLALGVIAVLAWRALRAPRGPEEAESALLERRSSRDEDPLSREANEWELYARQLAEQGRRREAIRAFYHAVLVTLFRSGRLHYQKGRTNWEYVARIGPEQRFRAELVELTRLFDREWYGHESSSAEALGSCAATARRILAAVRGAAEAAA